MIRSTATGMDDLLIKVRHEALLWCKGFREACCFHRVVSLCFRSRELLVGTGQCFILNGLIFLGSIFVLNSIVIPTLRWIIPQEYPEVISEEPCLFHGVLKIHTFLHQGLIQLFYILWFYPLYLLSLILSNLWYNDIAKCVFSEKVGTSRKNLFTVSQTTMVDKPAGIGRVMIGIGEQIYSVLLLSVFLVEVYATGCIPYIGRVLNFLLLSWIYAYYSFEYTWNFSQVGLGERLFFFESNWSFFSGFGSPCVLAIFFFSPLVSYGVMAILFPMFVLSATVSDVEQVIYERRKWMSPGLGRLPIFRIADALVMRIISLSQLLGSKSPDVHTQTRWGSWYKKLWSWVTKA